jgi:hypothetical protein
MVMLRMSVRRLAVALIALAALGSLTAGQAHAATFTVNDATELATRVASGSPGDEIVLTQFNYAPPATLTVNRDLTIRGPQSGPVRSAISGAGITTGNPSGVFNIFRVNAGVTLTLRDVTVTGIDISGSAADVVGTLNLENSTVSGALGAAITVRNGGTLNTLNSTLSDNATFGVTVVSGGTANLRSTTMAANDGGGISNAVGSTVTLQNTIVDSPSGADCPRAVQSSTNSLGSDSPGTCGAGTAVGNPLLDSSLTNNGGPTNTRRLLPGSPARDAGASNCPAADQRHTPRSAAPCDIGAYEADRTPPVLQLTNLNPPPTGPTTPVTYPQPLATEPDGFLALVDPVTCSPLSGSDFPSGATTSVNCTAANVDGLTSSGSFSVTIAAWTGPSVTVPPDKTVEATGPSGAVVSFANEVSATGGGAVTCAPASGSTFPLGTTTVTCSATSSGQTTTKTFTITVQDTTAPVVTPPASRTVEATSAAGAAVTYPGATATDTVDGSVAALCLPASGSAFPLGTTTVTCSASDANGNVGTAPFTVTVQDTKPPVVTVPGNLTLPAASSAGAVATFSASAADTVSGSRPVSCVPASGSTFSVGTTLVTCAAVDGAGNRGEAIFTVTVQPFSGPAPAPPAATPPPPTAPALSLRPTSPAKPDVTPKARALAKKIKASRVKARHKAALTKALARPSCSSLATFIARVGTVRRTRGSGLTAATAGSWVAAARSMRRSLKC